MRLAWSADSCPPWARADYVRVLHFYLRASPRLQALYLYNHASRFKGYCHHLHFYSHCTGWFTHTRDLYGWYILEYAWRLNILRCFCSITASCSPFLVFKLCFMGGWVDGWVRVRWVGGWVVGTGWVVGSVRWVFFGFSTPLLPPPSLSLVLFFPRRGGVCN